MFSFIFSCTALKKEVIENNIFGWSNDRLKGGTNMEISTDIVTATIAETLVMNIEDVVHSNLAIKSTIEKYKKKNIKVKTFVSLTELEKIGIAKLLRQIKSGPIIAVHNRAGLLRELLQEITKIEKNKNLTSLVRQIFGAKFEEVLVSVRSEPEYSDLQSKNKVKNRELVSLASINAELDFYKKRDRFKPSSRDIMSMLEICLFILIKQSLFLKTPKGVKPVDDESIYSVQSDLMVKYDLFNEDQVVDAELFLRTKRKHLSNRQKLLNVRDHMISLSCESGFDKFILDNDIKPFSFEKIGLLVP